MSVREFIESYTLQCPHVRENEAAKIAILNIENGCLVASKQETQALLDIIITSGDDAQTRTQQNVAADCLQPSLWATPVATASSSG